MTSLDTLAREFGIQDSALDARGKELVTSSETKLAMLAAMGVDASNESSALAALTALEDAERISTLPPVIVVYADAQPIQIPIVKPQGTGVIHWLLTLEDGTKRYGESQFQDLEQLERWERDDQVFEKRALIIAGEVPWGYHRFRLASEPMEVSVIVTPGKCWLPEGAKSGAHYWGVAAQLYLLRSKHNWGIGDFTDLKDLIEIAKESGADIVGVNPLHAMFPDRSEDASPYSPSDRNLLNVLNIDVEAIPEFTDSVEAQKFVSSEDFRVAVERCRNAPNVAYTEVAKDKLHALELVFGTFERQQEQHRHDAFRAFIAQRASLLERACIFQALRSYFADSNPELADCNNWPAEFKSFRSPSVAGWAHEHRAFVKFQMWLQWVADEQLRIAAEAATDMAIGIYRDLAVGAHPSGAEIWCHSDALLPNVHVGAPPDIWNPAGQDWGLPPFHPKRLHHEAYRPFIELLQSNMRYSGALRIDHAMALERLYWIPGGGSAKEGAFVEYPMDDLVGILALESHRNRCLVIGEDLGTVSAGFRERMAEANVLSYRVLFFERDDNGFTASDEYPCLSLSVASSHDLPTLQGWWRETDLDLKQSLNLFPTSELHSVARSQRLADRCDLLRRLGGEGLFNSCIADGDSFRNAAHEFLAKTNSMLTMVQLDDITEEVDQVNMPGTTDETPNWRRKQSLTLEELEDHSKLKSVAEAMRKMRSRAGAHDQFEVFQ
jgi:4-alpha-glucanotransferase